MKKLVEFFGHPIVVTVGIFAGLALASPLIAPVIHFLVRFPQ